MKKKYFLILSAAVLIGAVGFIVFGGKPVGETEESRELLLNREKEGAVILSEAEIDGHIIAAAETPSELGFAIFEPNGKGFKLREAVLFQNDVAVLIHSQIGGKYYDLFLSNQPDLASVKLNYTIGGEELDSLTMKAETNKIVYAEAPKENYSVEAVFYNKNGMVFR